MKSKFLLSASALLATLVLNVAHAADEIPRAERQKAARAVGLVYGSDISPDAVKPTTLPDIYQVRMPPGPVFVSKGGTWVVQGNLFNVEKRENMTEKAIADMQKVVFSELPLGSAIKFVRGNGSRKLVTFEDVNCGYCKKLATELEKLDNVTVYVLPVAMIAPTSREKALNVLCSDDPAQAWRSIMVQSKDSPVCKTKSKSEAAEKRMKLIQSHVEKSLVTGTPTLIFEDNTRVNGYIAVGELESRINAASNSKKVVSAK